METVKGSGLPVGEGGGGGRGRREGNTQHAGCLEK